MDRIPLLPPHIPAISSETPRPLWSVMIPVFNCAPFLKHSLNSVLMQDPGSDKMQIEVVDDCSTDADIKQTVEEIGCGRIIYYRQVKNVGSLRNFETCLKRAKGKYIHLLHGDDCLREGFYSKIGSLFQKFPEAGAACCAFDLIDNDGKSFFSSEKEANEPCILSNWLYKLAERPRVQFVCMVVKREVYEELGGFYLATFGEDWEMWVRIAKHYPTAYIPEALAQYRVHNSSISGNGLKSGNNLKSVKIIIDRITSYLPEKDQKKYNKSARKYCANIAIRQIFERYYEVKDVTFFKRQMLEAFRLYKSPKLLLKIFLVKLFLMLPEAWFKKLVKLVYGYNITYYMTEVDFLAQ